MRIHIRPLLWAGGLVLGLHGPLHAQDYAFQGFAAAEAMNQMHAAARDAMTAPGRAPGRAATPAAFVSTYRASPAVSARTREQFVAFVAQTSGDEAAQTLNRMLQRDDPVAIWAGLVRNEGLRPGDVVDAMAAYWLLNWMMATGGRGSRTQALAVREQVRHVMGGSPAVARLDDAGRQELTEVLMLNFLVQHGTYDDAVRRGDQAMQRRLGDAAVARFRQEMKLDLRQLALTDAGLRTVSR